MHCVCIATPINLGENLRIGNTTSRILSLVEAQVAHVLQIRLPAAYWKTKEKEEVSTNLLFLKDLPGASCTLSVETPDTVVNAAS